MDNKLSMYNAIMKQNEYEIYMLLNNGKNPNVKITPEGLEPLHKAVEYRNVNITSILLSRGADANSKDISDFGTLHALSMFIGIRDLFNRDKIEDVFTIMNYNYAPLEKDHDTRTLEIANMLLTSKANINMSTIYGSTPLHIAAKYKNNAMIKFLLERGADINVLDSKNNTPLFYSCYYGNTHISKMLIDYGAKVNLINNRGHSPLHYAVSSGNEELVKLLLVKNSYINVIDVDHRSVVHKAVIIKNSRILEILLKNKANCNIKDVNGYTALHYACKISDKIFTRILLNHGADPNSKNKFYRTPLYEAIIYGCYDNVEELLSYGADINVIDDEGNTPLSFLHTIDDKSTTAIISHSTINNLCYKKTDYVPLGVEVNNSVIKYNERYSYIKRKCEEEILYLRSVVFHSGYTAELFLKKNTNINLLSKFVKHPKVKNLESNTCFYSSIIKKSIDKATYRSELINNSICVIDSFQIFSVLPDVIKYSILEMLSNEELKILCSSG
ncbi:CNPV303 ankyrin repeat protein [Canarypox virus]|uniref:CNPV303 ankyrin repeat protein n=1 Tax=Canarypox virus TaxID=44088 RepID=Q6VZ44_CNPV|nr:CNPV303 ankyrin repeat protein [Canarypox virus]AAR83649.1 CNPV303 ankyrin repeat protein [Canarypox virus]AWD84779.1 ankyrin repeat protein [Canarypox virus]